MYDVLSRRKFLRAALAAGVSVPVASSLSSSSLPVQAEDKPANKLNLAVIGVAARGRDNLNGVIHENIVALCDIDAARLKDAAQAVPGAKLYDDYRKLFDDFKDLDGVVVSTPDHQHAIPACMALKRGWAVYCEKPLAHSVHEVRTMRELAAKHKCVTQMGTQIHAGDNYRRVVEMIQADVIGQVRKVHVWQGNSIQPGKLIKDSKVPEGINYDVWLGPAPYRPFHTSHFHFNWRYWWDFGGGILGDMGCHYIDLPFWALGLRAPTKITAKGEKTYEGDNTVPNHMRVDYEFAAQGKQPPLQLTWYHGSYRPEGAEEYGLGAAVLFEGDKGRLLADYGSRKVFLKEKGDPKAIAPTISNSVGHHQEWLNAIRSKGPTTCNFDYSGGLAETVLLGNVAYRTEGQHLVWNADELRATNTEDAAQYVKREYRTGWTL